MRGHMGNCPNNCPFEEPNEILLSIRHPKVWEPQTDPNLENHPYVASGLGVGFSFAA